MQYTIELVASRFLSNYLLCSFIKILFLFREGFPVDFLLLLAEGIALNVLLNASKPFSVSAVWNHSTEVWMTLL